MRNSSVFSKFSQRDYRYSTNTKFTVRRTNTYIHTYIHTYIQTPLAFNTLMWGSRSGSPQLKRTGQVEVADSSLVHQGRFSEVDTTTGWAMRRSWLSGESICVRHCLGCRSLIVWLTRLVKLWRSRSMSITAVVAPISRSSTFLPSVLWHCPCLIALFIPLLRTCVAMPHGTSRLYNSVSVSTVYTTSGLRPSVVYIP